MREPSRETIEKAALGDMGAFEEIYRVFSSIVYTAAFNITRNSQDAEEAAQDVFVKIFRKLPDFKFESSFGTWVYRITMNTAINIYNKRSRHRQSTVNIGKAGDIADAGRGGIEDVLNRESAQDKVAGLLNRLTPEHRACIMLREIEGLNYKEISNVLRIPLNTVRSRLKRAREALAAYFEKEEAIYGL